MTVIRDMLDERIVGGFVYPLAIDISETGFEGIHFEVR